MEIGSQGEAEALGPVARPANDKKYFKNAGLGVGGHHLEYSGTCAPWHEGHDIALIEELLCRSHCKSQLEPLSVEAPQIHLA